MAKKQLTATSKLLLGLLATGQILSYIFPTPKMLKSHYLYSNWNDYNDLRNLIYRLEKQGWIKYVDKNNERFIKLTNKGKLKALLSKIPTLQKGLWDGKWWIIMWDIPEESNFQRQHLRIMVKNMGFRKLQASVFISPYAISEAAMDYLHESGLVDHIRIIKVEKMDNDKDLKKKFNVK